MGDELKPPFPPSVPSPDGRCGESVKVHQKITNNHTAAPVLNRCEELVKLKNILNEWGMEDNDAKYFALRIIYGTSGLLTTVFSPRTHRT